MTVAEVLMKRKSAGIRQDVLALSLKWNRETLIDIERGRVEVSEHTLRQINSAIDQIERQKQGEEVMA